MFRSAIFCALALVAVAAQPVAAMDASMALPGDPAFTNLVSSEQALVDLTNQDRVANGLPALQLDASMLPVARERAEQQLGSQPLSHYDATGQLIFAQLLTQASLTYALAGENLARASVDDANVTQRVEQALMQSPTHRTNILEPIFKRVAIGAATDNTGQIAFAEVYRN